MDSILLVEDSPNIQNAVLAVLQNSFDVTTASDVAQAKTLIKEKTFKLILLDINLPDEDGFHFLSGLRSENNEIAVIFLTSQKELSDKMMAFSLGAEDFIEKPFDPAELKIRVEARLKKINAQNTQGEILKKGPFEVNLAAYTAKIERDGEQHVLDLTPNEMKLLVLLLRREDNVLERQEIVKEALGGIVVTERTIDTHINRLRHKLGPQGRYIQSVRSKGYKFSLKV